MRISDWSSDVCSSDLKDLHPAAARQALQLAEIVGILRRGADEEGMVAPRAPFRACQLFLQRCGVDRGGVGVRHLEHGGDPAHHRGAGAALEVRSEAHTSELPSLMRISYAVFCLKKKQSTSLIYKQQIT